MIKNNVFKTLGKLSVLSSYQKNLAANLDLQSRLRDLFLIMFISDDLYCQNLVFLTTLFTSATNDAMLNFLKPIIIFFLWEQESGGFYPGYPLLKGMT